MTLGECRLAIALQSDNRADFAPLFSLARIRLALQLNLVHQLEMCYPRHRYRVAHPGFAIADAVLIGP